MAGGGMHTQHTPHQNQFYLRRKNTMLIEQQLACDKGKAAKGPKWSSSQAATFKAE